MRFLLLASMILLTWGAAACGSAGTGPAASPSASPPSQLGVADSGRTIRLNVGDSIEVGLREQPGFSQWSHPTSTNTGVLAPQVDPRAAAVQGMTLGSFRATGRGIADIQSAAGAVCSPGTACPALARAWQVHVIVV